MSPLISNPFLSPDSKNKKLASTDSSGSRTLIDNDILPLDEHLKLVNESKLYVPYIVAGSICLVGSISLLVIYIYRRVERCALKNKLKQEAASDDPKANNLAKDDKRAADDYDDHADLQYTKSKLYLIQILLICSIMTSVFCASEMTTFQYASTFTVKLDLGLSKFIGSMMMTVIATSFAIGRFFGIMCAIKYKPLYILLFDWAIILLGNLILLFSNSDIKFLWVGFAAIGLGYASFFAAIFSFLRERIAVNNLMSSIVILASLSGNAIGK